MGGSQIIAYLAGLTLCLLILLLYVISRWVFLLKFILPTVVLTILWSKPSHSLELHHILFSGDFNVWSVPLCISMDTLASVILVSRSTKLEYYSYRWDTLQITRWSVLLKTLESFEAVVLIADCFVVKMLFHFHWFLNILCLKFL